MYPALISAGIAGTAWLSMRPIDVETSFGGTFVWNLSVGAIAMLGVMFTWIVYLG